MWLARSFRDRLRLVCSCTSDSISQVSGDSFGRPYLNWLVIASVASIGIIFVFFGLRTVCGDTLRKRPSVVQVLANDNEAWLFLEISWQVESGLPLASPPVMGRLRERFVFRHQSREWKEVSHTFCSPDSGAEWHSRCGRIVRLGEKFAVFEGPPFGSSEVSVFELTERGFAISSDPDLRKIAESANAVEATFDEFVNGKMESAGWQAILRDDGMFAYRRWNSPTHADPAHADSRFNWNGQEYSFERSIDDSGWATVSIVTGGQKTRLVRFDANKRRLTDADRKFIRRAGEVHSKERQNKVEKH